MPLIQSLEVALLLFEFGWGAGGSGGGAYGGGAGKELGDLGGGPAIPAGRIDVCTGHGRPRAEAVVEVELLSFDQPTRMRPLVFFPWGLEFFETLVDVSHHC